MSLSLSRQFPALLYIGNSPFSKQQPWPTKHLHRNNWRRFKRTVRQSSGLLGKSFPKKSVLAALVKANADFKKQYSYKGEAPNSGQSSKLYKSFGSFAQNRTILQKNAAVNHSKPNLKLSLLQMQNIWEKRLWFLHNALPMAAMLKPLKPNMLYGMQKRAALPLQIWIGQMGIQFLQKIAKRNLHFSYTTKKHVVWNYLTALESIPPILLTKIGWVSMPNEGRFWTKHSQIKINGFLPYSAQYVLRPADILQNKQILSTFWITKYKNISIYFPKTFFSF